MLNVTGGCIYDCIPDVGAIPGYPQVGVNECANEAYIWVDGYCSGGTGGTQSACEADGGTWVPAHYECDPAFVYDTSVSFAYDRDERVYPTEIDYVNGQAWFNEPVGTIITVCYWHGVDALNIFDEYHGDLDELRHTSFTPRADASESIYTIFTKHVAVGMMTTGTLTIDSADWVVNWGVNNYFNSWTSPDGLAARSPGTSRIISDRPLTHHDTFYTGDIDVYGGFLYEPATSNGFLQRSVVTEIKLQIPVNHDTDFDTLYAPATSNGFLQRMVETEIKLGAPVTHNTDFKWLYGPETTPGFVERSIDNEDKIDGLLCHNADFCWAYYPEAPWVDKHRFVKNGGNDALDGKTFATAWSHWSYAMANIAEDGRLYAADGTYMEPGIDMSPQVGFQLFLITTAGEDAPCAIEIVPA